MSDSSLRQRRLGSTFLGTGFIQLVFSHEELKPELKVVSFLLDSGVLGSNVVREGQCFFKTIEKEGLQGGKGDEHEVDQPQHIHDPGIQQEPRDKLSSLKAVLRCAAYTRYPEPCVVSSSVTMPGRRRVLRRPSPQGTYSAAEEERVARFPSRRCCSYGRRGTATGADAEGRSAQGSAWGGAPAVTQAPER